MAKISAIVFDLGKVIFNLSFDRVYEYWASVSGKEYEIIKSKFKFDELSDTFEKGLISEQRFRTLVSERLKFQLSDKDFDKGWCNLYLKEYDGIDTLLAILKINYRLIALTNTNAIHYKVWTAKYYKTLKYFEKIFSSHKLAARKPEKEIYEIVLRFLNLNPNQILFLDDNIENVIGAKDLGMLTILVSSQEQMKEELKQFGLINQD